MTAAGGQGEPAAAVVPAVTDEAVLAAVAAGRDEVPWRGWDALAIALLGLACMVALYAVVPVTSGGNGPPPLPETAILLAVTLAWLRLVRGRGAVRRVFGPRLDLRTVLPGVALGVCVGAAWPLLDTAMFLLLELSGATMPPVQEHLEEWITTPGAGVLVALDVVILTPLEEELLFRGVLFLGLARRWGGPAAAVVSSLVFGLAHVESAGLDSVFLVLSAGLFGLACAWLLQRWRTLLAPIAAHMATNAVATAALLAS